MTASTTRHAEPTGQHPGPPGEEVLAERRRWWAAAAVFLVATFAISWGAWGLLLALGGSRQPISLSYSSELRWMIVTNPAPVATGAPGPAK